MEGWIKPSGDGFYFAVTNVNAPGDPDFSTRMIRVGYFNDGFNSAWSVRYKSLTNSGAAIIGNTSGLDAPIFNEFNHCAIEMRPDKQVYLYCNGKRIGRVTFQNLNYWLWSGSDLQRLYFYNTAGSVDSWVFRPIDESELYDLTYAVPNAPFSRAKLVGEIVNSDSPIS